MIFPLRSPFIVDFSFPWILRWIWPHVSTGTRAKEPLEPLGSALPSSKGLRAKGSQSRGEPSVFSLKVVQGRWMPWQPMVAWYKHHDTNICIHVFISDRIWIWWLLLFYIQFIIFALGVIGMQITWVGLPISHHHQARCARYCIGFCNGIGFGSWSRHEGAQCSTRIRWCRWNVKTLLVLTVVGNGGMGWLLNKVSTSWIRKKAATTTF
jgi:hypothetical protein